METIQTKLGDFRVFLYQELRPASDPPSIFDSYRDWNKKLFFFPSVEEEEARLFFKFWSELIEKECPPLHLIASIGNQILLIGHDEKRVVTMFDLASNEFF